MPSNAGLGLELDGGGLATGVVLCARTRAVDEAHQRELMASFCAEVQRAGGRPCAVVGAEMFALFGLRGMRRHELESAVDAALKLAGGGHGAEMAVGIALGEVRSHAAGVQWGTALAGGAAAEEAREAARVGEPGDVLARPRTLHELQGRFEASDAGDGWRQVTGRARGETSFLEMARGARRAPTIGRELELMLLQRAAERARREGALVAVALVGARGAGRSRICGDLVGALPDWRHLAGRCGAGFGAYGPVLEMLRGEVEGRDEPDLTARLRGLLGNACASETQLGHRAACLERVLTAADETADLRNLLAAGDQEALFEAAAVFVEAARNGGPLVLVVEDFDAADDASVAIVRHIALRCGQAPVLLLLTAEPGARIGDLGLPLERSSAVDVPPLSEAHGAEVLAELLGVPSVPAEVIERVQAFAEGLPSAIEEAADALLEDGCVQEALGGRELLAGAALSVLRRGLGELALRRVGRLPPRERALLWAAAVGGDGAPLPMLGAMLQRELQADDARQAMAAGYLKRVATPRFAGCDELRFCRQAVGELIASSLPPSTRAELHARAAKWLQAWQGPRPAGFGAMIAHHYLGAQQRDGAAACLLRAALDAASAADNRGAFEAYGVALEVAQDAVATPSEAAGKDGADADTVFRAAIGRAEVGAAVGEVQAAILASDLALQHASEATAPGGHCRALIARANARRLGSDFSGAVEDAMAALRIATRHAGMVGEAVEAAGLVAVIELHRGRADEARKLATRAVSADGGPVPARSLLRGQVRGRTVLGHLAARAGDHQDALRHYQLARQLCDMAGAKDFAHMVDMAIGNLAYRRGLLDDAARVYEASMRGSDELDDRYAAAVARTNLSNVLHDRERVDEALVHLREAERVFRQVGADDNLAESLRLISSCLLARGELRASRAAAAESQQLARSVGNDGIVRASAEIARRAEEMSEQVSSTTIAGPDARAPTRPVRKPSKQPPE